MSEILVRADEIEQGGWFVKKNGHFAYLKLSESSVRFLGLDEDHVHGVCFNGNMTMVRLGALVRQATFGDYLRNIADQDDWERLVGCKPERKRKTVITITEE